jgi:hypothetical protein
MLFDGADHPGGIVIFKVPYPEGVAHAIGPFVYVIIILFPEEPATTEVGDITAEPSPITGVLVGVMV